ncbi:cell wall-binding repeat-containing protein [Actinomyces minihominis]|uniref:cell wall-binding repeat-containing protein n=1 Tax=Actinomyces minihominis TaxID=2002838 RepID=UPI000C089A55|nr:cell wall-binding repeat-containing protein [Actinomyces minihominis]
MSQLRTRFDRVTPRLLGLGACSALVLAGLTFTSSEQAFADSPESASLEPTESSVEFTPAAVSEDYTTGGPVEEGVGNEQQLSAVASVAVEQEVPEGLLDVNLVRANLETDNALIAVTWDADAPDPEAITLRYLLEGDWSEWIELGIETEVGGAETDRPALGATQPFTLFYADAVEVLARSSDGIPVPGLTLTVIDAETTGEIENALVAPVTDNSVEVVEEDTPALEEHAVEESRGPEVAGDELLDLDGAATSEGVALQAGLLPTVLNSTATVFDAEYAGLQINTRKGWGADESLMTWPPKPNTIQGVVVHHTESSGNYTKDQVAQQIRNIYYYHAVTLGWGDIGYNLIVDRFGGVWEGRAGGLSNQVHAAHAGNANGQTVGITVLGNFMTVTADKVVEDSLAKTIAWKLQLHGINSVEGTTSVKHEDGTLKNVPVVSGHRDVGWTDCPGDALYARIPALRTAVTAYMGANTVVPPGTSLPGLPATFSAGNVISDELFYNSGVMNTSEIKTFIETTGKDCKPGAGTTCLKDTTFSTVNLTTLRGGCKPLSLSGTQTPWTIISEAAKACGLNPQVILTTLQKEQSGLTQPKSAAVWAKAMGSGCPDGSGCDPAQGGFEKQVYYGADKLVSYRLQSQAGHVDAFKAGRAMTVLHNPSTACGSESVKFANVATASLYEYTPYIGNSSVAGCSAVGAKSFYDIYKRYFPDAVITTPPPTFPLDQVVRLSGADRIATNVAVNQETMKSGRPLFIATSSDYADALSAGPAAAVTGGALMLSSSGGLNAASLDLIKVRRPSEVFLVGGSSVVPDKVATQLQKVAPGTAVTRISGRDRYGTSAALMEKFFKGRAVASVFIATGRDYPDALTASSVAGALASPVLLVNGVQTERLGQQAADFLAAKKPSRVIIVGGEGAVNGTLEGNLRRTYPGTQRVSGRDRYATNLALNDYLGSNGGVAPSKVWIATGKDFPDALSAAVPAGLAGQRLVLSNGKCIPKPVVSQWLNSATSKVKSVRIVGGSGVLAPSVASLTECP